MGVLPKEGAKKMHIKTKKGLQELLRRYEEAKAPEEDKKVIEGCIKEGLAMDETDFENAEPRLRKLWKGLQ
jgi:hypothetical protein